MIPDRRRRAPSAWRCLVRIVVLAVALALPGPVLAQDAPVVEAPAGSLRGAAGAGVNVFRGVPYARPPVGDLRWRPPAPLPSWSGVRDATRFGAACMQPASPFADLCVR